MGRWRRRARPYRRRAEHRRSREKLSGARPDRRESRHRTGETQMSDDKNPPLPDLEADVELVPSQEGDAGVASDAAKSAAELEAVFDVPVHVSAVLGRTRMD